MELFQLSGVIFAIVSAVARIGAKGSIALFGNDLELARNRRNQRPTTTRVTLSTGN
jgi:hypothetical protein